MVGPPWSYFVILLTCFMGVAQDDEYPLDVLSLFILTQLDKDTGETTRTTQDLQLGEQGCLGLFPRCAVSFFLFKANTTYGIHACIQRIPHPTAMGEKDICRQTAKVEPTLQPNNEGWSTSARQKQQQHLKKSGAKNCSLAHRENSAHQSMRLRSRSLL